jgi:hypothetical protein
MDQQTLVQIMTIFVIVAAFAMVVQAGLLFGIYKASRSMHETVSRLAPRIDSLLETSKNAIEDSRSRLAEVSVKTNDILDNVRVQLARLDDLMVDASARTHKQLEHAELVIEDAMSRAHEAVAAVHGGVMKPIREISGLAVGLRAAFQHLMRGARPSPERFTADEEMFI